MTCIKHRLIVWWSTLLIILAALLIPLPTAVVGSGGDASAEVITMELCGPQGQHFSYTITLDGSGEKPLYPGAHCLFCLLPVTAEAIISTQSLLQLRQLAEPGVQLLIPPFVLVPTPLDRWLPHQPLAPPVPV